MSNKVPPEVALLSSIERAFVYEFIKRGGKNAQAAAVKAGYSKKSAHVQACRMLKRDNIREAIRAITEQNEAGQIDTVHDILKWLTKIRRTPITQFLQAGADGVTYVDVGPETEDAEILVSVSSVTTKDGNNITTRCEKADPLRAADMLLRIKGAYKQGEVDASAGARTLAQIFAEASSRPVVPGIGKGG